MVLLVGLLYRICQVFYDDLLKRLWYYDMRRNGLTYCLYIVNQGSYGAWSDSLHTTKSQMLLLPCESGMCKPDTYRLCSSRSESILIVFLFTSIKGLQCASLDQQH